MLCIRARHLPAVLCILGPKILGFATNGFISIEPSKSTFDPDFLRRHRSAHSIFATIPSTSVTIPVQPWPCTWTLPCSCWIGRMVVGSMTVNWIPLRTQRAASVLERGQPERYMIVRRSPTRRTTADCLLGRRHKDYSAWSDQVIARDQLVTKSYDTPVKPLASTGGIGGAVNASFSSGVTTITV
jgi:hypothetical protein